jgi:predicted RNA-binding protein YlqC (UPF0109 family)
MDFTPDLTSSSKNTKLDTNDLETKADLLQQQTQEVRCLIDNHAVGGIIGKSGCNVKRIREEAAVFLSILKTEHVKAVKDRVMLIKGPLPNIAKAALMIANLLVEIQQQNEKKQTVSVPVVMNASVATTTTTSSSSSSSSTTTPTSASTSTSTTATGTGNGHGNGNGNGHGNGNGNGTGSNGTVAAHDQDHDQHDQHHHDHHDHHDHDPANTANNHANNTNNNANGNANGAATYPNTKDTLTDTETTVFKILVHRSAVGAVIGKAGAVIKETQLETSARVQVSNEPLPNSTEKTITITGTPMAIHNAMLRILTQLRDNPLKQGVRVILYVPGQPMFMPMPSYGYGYGQGMLYGGGGGPMYAPPRDLRSVGTGGGLMYAPPPPHTQQHHKQELSIPSVCAGGVIGKGGVVIRDLRAQTGTSISIADPDQTNPAERIVTISGPPQGIQHAMFLIRTLVEQYQPNPQANQY